MAEWRRHYKKINRDKRYMKLSFGGRLMFRGLIDHADDEGFFEADSSELKAAIFPADTISVTDTLRYRDEVVQAGLAVVHLLGDEEYIELPKFQKHQQTRRDLFKPSEIKARIKLARKETAARDVPVTDSSRTRHIDKSREERSREEQKEQEQKLSAPKTAPEVENPKSAKATQSKGPSPAQVDNREDVEELVAMFNRRFPDSDKEMIPAVAQTVLEVCKAEWRHPQWLIEQVSLKSDHPINYLYALMKKRPFATPADGERAFWSWDRWRDRQRKSGPVGNHVGNVVNSIMERVS